MTIPKRVIDRDHELEADATRSAEALAKHRWHWTADESNPNRISFAEYGRAVGRNEASIRKAAAGYARFARTGGDPRKAISITDAIELEHVRHRDRDLMEQTAKGLGVSVVTARQHHPDVVETARRAVASAREREPDITPDREDEVARRAAENVRKSREINRRHADRIAESVPALVTLLEGELHGAHEKLTAAISYAKQLTRHDVPDGFLEKMQLSLQEIDSASDMLKAAIGGVLRVNWDDEMARLTS